MQPTLIKSYTRDFCLPITEIWYKAETTDPRQWTHLMQPVKPYNVFIRSEGQVDYYVDPAGIDWIKTQLKERIKQDGFIDTVISTYSSRVDQIKPIYDAEKILNRDELIDYMARLENCWVWHEANWFLSEVLEESQHEKLAFVKEAAEKYSQLVYSSDPVIRKSLRSIFPELNELSSALLVEEIVSGSLPTLEKLEKRFDNYSFTNGRLYSGEGVAEMEQRFNIVLK